MMQSNDAKFLATQMKFNSEVLTKNLEGISPEEAMVFPNGEANNVNWILGHLIFIRNQMIKILGSTPVWKEDENKFYAQYAKPLEHKNDLLPFEELKSALKKSQDGLDSAIKNTEKLDERNIEDLAGLMLHEIYHASQFGYLRRILGKKGAI